MSSKPMDIVKDVGSTSFVLEASLEPATECLAARVLRRVGGVLDSLDERTLLVDVPLDESRASWDRILRNSASSPEVG